MSKDTPAFPNSVQPDFQWAEPGMTLRQWYAGMALPAIITATSAGQHQPGQNRKGDPITSIVQLIAHDAFEMADAMLAHEESE